jgi:hypothetical protein
MGDEEDICCCSEEIKSPRPKKDYRRVEDKPGIYSGSHKEQ